MDASLTEDKWMSTEWSPAELQLTFEDESVEGIRREHAFWRYWAASIDSLERPITREELEEIIARQSWHYVAGELIVRCARSNKLALTDAAWVLPYLTAASWAADQTRALLLLHDADVDWRDKLAKVLEYRADWAAIRILRALPADSQPEAEAIILASARHKAAKWELLGAMKTRG